jgi:hypothetical protein
MEWWSDELVGGQKKENAFNSLRTDGDFCHQGRDMEIAQKI